MHVASPELVAAAAEEAGYALRWIQRMKVSEGVDSAHLGLKHLH